MALGPPPPPLPNPDSSHLVGTIEAMLETMQQQNANMMNQHNLAPRNQIALKSNSIMSICVF